MIYFLLTPYFHASKALLENMYYVYSNISILFIYMSSPTRVLNSRTFRLPKSTILVNSISTVLWLTEKWTEDMSRAALETEPEVFGADLPSPPSLDPDALNFLMQIATGSLNEPAYTVYAAMNEYAQSKGNAYCINMAFLSVFCFIIRNTCKGKRSSIYSLRPSFCPNLKGEGRNEGQGEYI